MTPRGWWLCRLGLHRWSSFLVEESVWPQHYGHTERKCVRCGRRRS